MACLVKRRDRWVIDFYDQKGERHWKTMPKDCTKGRAKEELRAIEEAVAKGFYFTEAKTHLFQKVAADWLDYKKPNVRESTWSKYEGYVKSHFTEILDLKINNITTATVEKFIIARQNVSMNITTLRKLIVTFNQIMNYAVRHKYVDHNPVRDAERPRGKGGVEAQPIRVLSPEEAMALLEQVTGQKYQTLFMLAIMSGARQGELFGLKWSDVDYENNQIHIQRTFNSGTWYKPKSATSNRKIDLGPAMMGALRRWRMACPPNELDLMFPNENGQPLDPTNVLRRILHPALVAAGLPIMRFHDLRHTYASLLIEQGGNIKYIQAQLGHASPTVTLNVYAHLMRPTNQESPRKLEESVFGATGSKVVADALLAKKKGVNHEG
ncbi:MAG: site-specific integrase [Deltaproteobacteria bacterium]|nr:site-specific integrase [Deltaproteobacteria bacterium]